MSYPLKVKLLDKRATYPNRAHEGDLGFDLFAIETTVIQAGETKLVRTGIAIQFPEGWGAVVKARSSQGKRGIDILGGVIDQGYRGEIGALVCNTNDPLSAAHEIYYEGDKIGQLVLVPVFPGWIEGVNEFDNETARGEKGFGSTGR
jgi:dUTP pyrophosphatase